MQRRITIDGLTYICNVSHRDNIEYWRVAYTGAERIAKELEKNGMVVLAVKEDLPTSIIEIDKNAYRFNGKTYKLHQCDGDLFEWHMVTTTGEFTYYYDKVVFVTSDGVIAAYRDDITNVIRI